MTITIEDLQKDLTKGLDQVQETQKKQSDEVKNELGTVKTELSGKIEGVETELDSVKSSLDQVSTEVKNSKESLESRMDELESEIVRDNPGPEVKLSAGEKFVQQAEYQEIVNKNGKIGDLRMTFENYSLKTIGSSATSAGDTARSERVDGIYQNATLNLRVQDFIPQRRTERQSIDYIQEIRPLQLETEAFANAATAQANLQVKQYSGFRVGSTVTIGNLKYEIDSIAPGVGDDKRAGTLTFTGNLTVAVNKGDLITADDFDWTPEGEYKAELGAQFEEVNEQCKTLAAYVQITRQIFEDSAMLQNYIDNRLPLALDIQTERDIFYGDGINQIHGLFNRTEIPQYSKAVNGIPTDTHIDSIRRAGTVVELSHFMADVVFVNPKDWEKVDLAKGADEHYVNVVRYDANGMPYLWKMYVVSTPAVKQGEFLLGNLRVACEFWTRKDIVVYSSDSHSDNFVKNIMAILAEKRAALAVYLPKSLVRGSFT